MAKIKLIRIDLDQQITGLVDRCSHKTLGIWAADCALRVIHYFTEKYPADRRPSEAIAALQVWIQNGKFKMADIRRVALAAHAAAREVNDEDTASRAAARAAGQAVGTAHVPRHALGAAIYAATAVFGATGSMDEVKKERDWQYRRLLELYETTDNTITAQQKLWRGK